MNRCFKTGCSFFGGFDKVDIDLVWHPFCDNILNESLKHSDHQLICVDEINYAVMPTFIYRWKEKLINC